MYTLTRKQLTRCAGYYMINQLVMFLKSMMFCLAFTGSRAANDEFSECKLIPTTVHRGEKGEINCFFPVNITDKDFTVDLYPDESSDYAKTIVDCFFMGTEHKCYVKPGFSFNPSPGKVQTVRIVNAAKEWAGVYRCHIHDLLDMRSEHCTLKYEEEANIEDSKLTVPGNVPEKGKGDMAPWDPGADPTLPQSTSLIVGICVGAGVFCFCSSVAVGIIIRRRKRREEERNNRPTKNLIYNLVSTNPVVTV